MVVVVIVAVVVVVVVLLLLRLLLAFVATWVHRYSRVPNRLQSSIGLAQKKLQCSAAKNLQFRTSAAALEIGVHQHILPHASVRMREAV